MDLLDDQLQGFFSTKSQSPGDFSTTAQFHLRTKCRNCMRQACEFY